MLNQITYLPSLREAVFPKPKKGQTAAEAEQSGVTGEPPPEVIDSYSGVLSILFALDNEITTGSGDVALGDDVRALSALSEAEDQASQQRAILYGALLASALNDAGPNNGTGSNNVTGPVALADFGGLDAFSHRAGPPVRRPADVRGGGHPGADAGRQQRRGQHRRRSPRS